MPAPPDRRYLQTHEWHKLEGDEVTIGITDVAADELTDITYVSLPKVGDRVTVGHSFGEIDSVKASSDLYSGVSGTVVAVNEKLAGEPGLVNRDPFGEGWMIKVEPADAGELETLLSAEEYLKRV
jgi:glycine cleavage system H protein